MSKLESNLIVRRSCHWASPGVCSLPFGEGLPTSGHADLRLSPSPIWLPSPQMCTTFGGPSATVNFWTSGSATSCSSTSLRHLSSSSRTSKSAGCHRCRFARSALQSLLEAWDLRYGFTLPILALIKGSVMACPYLFWSYRLSTELTRERENLMNRACSRFRLSSLFRRSWLVLLTRLDFLSCPEACPRPSMGPCLLSLLSCPQA